jgi:hypothetical protein
MVVPRVVVAAGVVDVLLPLWRVTVRHPCLAMLVATHARMPNCVWHPSGSIHGEVSQRSLVSETPAADPLIRRANEVTGRCPGAKLFEHIATQNYALGVRVPTFPDLWTSFWVWLDAHPASAFLFRGQADKSPILPKIGRSAYNYEPARERGLHDAFMRAARPFLPMPLSSPWEWLALAQHHGAPTRLADWSTSPLVAAWFAVTSYPETTDAAIFALELAAGGIETLDITTGRTASGARFDGPFAMTKDVYLIETAPISARITTQRGIFTVHGNPQMPLDVPASDTFDIPNALRSDFQGRLLDLGIDASHIFPDLDGVCKTLDWKLKSGRGFSSIT